MGELNKKLHVLIVKPVQMPHVVFEINSKKFDWHKLEEIQPEQWLVSYFGTEIIRVAKLGVVDFDDQKETYATI